MSILDSEKSQNMLSEMRGHRSIAVAFSGGVDSAVVAAMAKRALGDKAWAITANSETLGATELEYAIKLAEEIGIRHEIMAFSELEDDNFVANTSARCFFCQSMRFDKLKEMAAKVSVDIVASGTNIDDLSDHRPGLKAMSDRKIYQPLLVHQFTKSEVRELAKNLGLSCWNRPAKACLSSRIPHGLSVTFQRLQMIEIAEDALMENKFLQFRIRHHDGLARIETSPEEQLRFLNHPNRAFMIERILGAGFDRVCFDLRGYRQGSLNPTQGVLSPPLGEG